MDVCVLNRDAEDPLLKLAGQTEKWRFSLVSQGTANSVNSVVTS
jgi:hypothetical protein